MAGHSLAARAHPTVPSRLQGRPGAIWAAPALVTSIGRVQVRAKLMCQPKGGPGAVGPLAGDKHPTAPLGKGLTALVWADLGHRQGWWRSQGVCNNVSGLSEP